MKARRRKSRRGAVLAAGGIVMRCGRRPLIAVVQRRKDNTWVLPKGKLKRHETAMAAARREAIEETGTDVRLREFLGAISYKANGKPKVVQFWHMQSVGGRGRKLTADIRAVKWLPLGKAVARLTQPLERAFLGQVGRRRRKRSTGVAMRSKARARKAKSRKARSRATARR